jgi:3'-phosphoadenosine 5'-phosphosulfate (PAPS) 3'-phosphatase
MGFRVSPQASVSAKSPVFFADRFIHKLIINQLNQLINQINQDD